MIDQEILAFFWPKIILAIVYIMNRITSSTLQNITLQQFVIDQVYPDKTLHILDILYFRVFGYKVYILIKKKQQVKSNKIIPCTKISILIGYKNHNIQRVYLPRRYRTKVVYSSYIRFDERGIVTELFQAGSSMPKTRSKGEIIQDFHNHNKETNEPVQPISKISFNKDQQP